MSLVVKILLIAVAVAFFCWFFVRRLFVDTTPRNRHVYQALRSPSVRGAASALERRIALAVREASHEARMCTVCSFANTTRMKVASCTLCGASLEIPPRRGLVRLLPEHRTPIRSETDVAQGPSTRQRRVQRRREWTRQIETDGSIVWYHHPEFESPSTTKFPAYVIQSEPSSAVVETDDTIANEITIRVESEAKTESAQKHLANRLEAQFKDTRLTVIEVDKADPTCVAFASSTINLSSSSFQLDYPAKLVQFMTSVASLLSESNTTSDLPSVARFSISREQLWAESVEAIATMTPNQVRYPIRVEFIGEPGIDAGALYREWVGSLNKAMATPEAGIFTCVDPHEQIFYLNAQSQDVLGENHLTHFLVAGRLVGRALLDGNVTGFQLAPPLLKIMLGLPVSFQDLEYYDAEAFKNLEWLMANDQVDTLGLDFTVVEKLPDGKTRVVELVPDGSNIDVTDDNKLEYVDRKLKYTLFESVQGQLSAFLTGLYEVVPAELLASFDAEELGLLLSGSDEIDVDDWEANTVAFVESVASERKPLNLLPCYENFWKVVREMTNDERRRLLHFATGSTRPPPGGFSSLTSYDGRLSLFTLRGVPEDTTHGYLQSHACFNRVDLPTFWTYKPMRKAMYAAISFNEDGFTIQ